MNIREVPNQQCVVFGGRSLTWADHDSQNTDSEQLINPEELPSLAAGSATFWCLMAIELALIKRPLRIEIPSPFSSCHLIVSSGASVSLSDYQFTYVRPALCMTSFAF